MEAKTNLNKNNFFDEDLMTRYPVAAQKFTDWLSDYAMGTSWPESHGESYFTFLPFEMQVGILVRFIDEHNPSDLSLHYFQEYYTQDLTDPTSVINWFANFLCWYDQDHNPDHEKTNPKGEDDGLPF